MLKRMVFVLARIYLSLREGNVPSARGPVAQSLKMLTQTVYDQGNCAASWTVLPFEDPALTSTSPAAHPPAPEHLDLSAGLLEAHEMMASLSYVRDQANLGKARAERLQKAPPAARSEEAQPKGPRRPRGGRGRGGNVQEAADA